MKELGRSADLARVLCWMTLLEAGGVTFFVQNESTQQALVTGIFTAIAPLPLFFPTLHVVDDSEYPQALALLHRME